MKSSLVGLGFVLLVGACASDEPANDCQPGDIDCAADGASGGGKADGFDYKNDPTRMSQHLTYKLADLPKKGFRDTPVWKDRYPEAVGKAATIWADTYWPTSEGSHNNRWQGPTVKSPLEKYDAAFNNAPGCATHPDAFYGAGAKAKWDTYYSCAGPAAKWQSQNFQGGGDMHDGVDNDGDGKVDDYGDDGIDGIQGWWGTCHAWTPASQLVPEPQHAVTLNGVTFEVGDIKALVQNSFDSTSAVMLGGRCNSKEITHDVHGSANDDCSDVNPGALHVIMTNFLGLTKLPLIEDKHGELRGVEPAGRRLRDHEAGEGLGDRRERVRRRDRQHVDVQRQGEGAVRGPHDRQYIIEGYPGTDADRLPEQPRTTTTTTSSRSTPTGKVIGGRYCTDTENSHIDFLWSPTGTWGQPVEPERRRRERQEARQALGRVATTAAAAPVDEGLRGHAGHADPGQHAGGRQRRRPGHGRIEREGPRGLGRHLAHVPRRPRPHAARERHRGEDARQEPGRLGRQPRRLVHAVRRGDRRRASTARGRSTSPTPTRRTPAR